MSFSLPTELASVSTNTNGQTSWTPTLTGIPSNSLAFLCFDNAGGTGQPTSVSDGTNSWTNITGSNDSRSSLDWLSLWFFYYASAPGSLTLTVSFASSNEIFGYVGFVTGSNPAPSDVSGNSGGGSTSTSPSATTSAVRTADNELIIWMAGNHGGTGTPTVTVPTGYTELHTSGSTFYSDAVRVKSANFGYLIDVGGTGTTASGTGTNDSSRQWSCGIATFIPGTGGGGGGGGTVPTLFVNRSGLPLR